MRGNGLPASNDLQRLVRGACAWHCQSVTRQRQPIDAIDQWPAIQHGESESDGAFGKPVHGGQRLAVESIACEPLCEALERLCPDRLGAVEGQTPAAKVKTGQLGIAHLRS